MKNVPMVSLVAQEREPVRQSDVICFPPGNTEEEIEEYTEMFEHIDEYRLGLKKSSKKSRPVEESDGSASDTTESDNESDPSSEEEDEIDDKRKSTKTKN